METTATTTYWTREERDTIVKRYGVRGQLPSVDEIVRAVATVEALEAEADETRTAFWAGVVVGFLLAFAIIYWRP